MNTPSYMTVELLKRAKAEVAASPLYKRFISGTPLENDIAVWMADFAGQVLHEAEASSPSPECLTLDRLDARPFNLTLEDLRDLIRTEAGHIAYVNDELDRLKALHAAEIERLKASPPVADRPAWLPK